MKNKTTQAVADSRRSFIKTAATATTAVAATGFLKTPVYGQNTAPSANVAGANNKITVGFVGVGGRGTHHVSQMKKMSGELNIELVAACDVSKHCTNRAKGIIGENCATFEDHRKMMERKDIDAIVCATVDHWHTKVSLDAMNSGKHIYVEKPMTRYLHEAFQCYDTAKRTKKILQVGSQGCSAGAWHEAGKLVRAGKIGPLVRATGAYCRNNPKGEWNYGIQQWATKDDINWNLWLGSEITARKDFDADHFFRWRKYFAYCGGLLGDLMPHRLHPLMVATGAPEFPVRVCSIGTRKVETDKKTPGTYMRDVAEDVTLLAEFPSGLTLTVRSSTVNSKSPGFMINGHWATIEVPDAGNALTMTPEKNFTDDVDPVDMKGLTPEGEAPHYRNWFSCIRENKEANAGPELALRVQTVISLAEMSDRLKVTCLFDEKTRKITDAGGKELKPLTYGSIEGQS